MKYKYERLKEDHSMQYCPVNDYDGSITGQIVMDVKAWFDEHPEERMKRGWIKHFYYDDPKEVQRDFPYDPATQYLIPSTKRIDAYTIQDIYCPIPKPAECMAMEEMLELMNIYVPSGMMILDSQGGALV